jgi:plastocyanin
MKQTALFAALIAILFLPAIAAANPVGHPSASESSVPMDQMSGAGVTIVDFAFQPAYVVVPAGGTVTWYNAGGAPHTATSDWGTFDSGYMAPGGSSSVTFWSPGVFSYHCAIHPGMVGTVEVTGM